MARLSIQLLGTFQVTLDAKQVTEFTFDKVRALLAYLVVEVERPHRREKLAGLLWGDFLEESARSNLRRALATLRKAIGDHQADPPFLLITRQTIQFNPGSDYTLDVREFDTLLKRADQTEPAYPYLEKAVALYHGGFLGDLSIPDSASFDEWATLMRESLQREALGALQDLTTHFLEKGSFEEAIPYVRRELELDQFREDAHRSLMRALASLGRRSEALSQYESCKRILKEELGIDPSEETISLYKQIQEGTFAVPVCLQTISTKTPTFLEDRKGDKVEPPVFVARERELSWLNHYLDKTIEAEGQVVFLAGGAGRGKTALLGKFAHQAMEVHPDLLATWGNCSAFVGVGDPYHPFREIMGMLTGEVEGRLAAGFLRLKHAQRLWKNLTQTTQVLLDHGKNLIDVLVPRKALLERLEVALPGGVGSVEPLKLLAEQRQTDSGNLEQAFLFQQLTKVLQTIAAQNTLLIMLDDLQWADTSSIGMLFHLVRHLKGNRILVLGAYRPGEAALNRTGERSPLQMAIAEIRRYHGDVILDLAQSTDQEDQHFVEMFLDSEPNRFSASFRQALYQHTGGHPLFTVELVRAMIGRGELVKNEAGEWQESETLDWNQLPARVEAVIEERINRLDDELRGILQVASVEGEEFTAQVVTQVQGLGERQLLRQLSQAMASRHRLVRERGEVMVGDQNLQRYQFTHALVQRYLYESLSAAERRLLHRDVGEVLETLYGDQREEISVQLARHFEDGRVPEKTRRYLYFAGLRAARQYANQEAVDFFTRALDLTPADDQESRWDLYMARTMAFSLLGKRDLQRADLEALERLADEFVEPGHKVEVALRRAWYAEATGDYPGAIAAAQQAVSKAEAAGNQALLAEANLIWGRTRWRQGDLRENQEQLRRALTLSQEARVPWIARMSLRFMALSAYGRGDYITAQGYSEEALSVSSEHGDRRGETRALYSLGLIHLGEGDYTGGRNYLRKSLKISRENGDRLGESYALYYFGMLTGNQGDITVSRNYYDQALAIARRTGDRYLEGLALTGIGYALIGLEKWDDAETVFMEAAAIRKTLGIPPLLMESQAGLAGVALGREELKKATEKVNDILAFLDSGGSLDSTASPFRIYLICAQVLEASQNPRARDVLKKGYALLRERAEKIQDEDKQRSFLDNVPWHRELVAEANRQGLG